MTCVIEGCSNDPRARGLCSNHWRSVDAAPCAVSGCGETSRVNGLCNMHYQRVRRFGDPAIVNPGGRPLKGEFPTWAAIHKRLSRKRGKAKMYRCVSCGGPAAEWSYDRKDPAPLQQVTRGVLLTYSEDLNRYSPRCVPCHRRFDLCREAA